MTVSDKAGKELSKLTYTYDLAGNKLTSTEEVDGKEEEKRFTYDDNNRLTQLENKDGITTYTYDQNGNRISSKKNDEQLDYIYDTENRLLAVKDKDGLLMAALYDGDDNRVFTASRKEGKHTYQLFKREEKKSPYTAPNGEEHSLFWYGFSQNVLQALSSLPQTVGTIWHEIFDDVSIAYHKKVAKDRANEEGLVVNPPSIGDLPGEGEVTYSSQVKEVLIPYTTREDSFNYYEERNYVNDVNREHTEVLQTYDRELKGRETYTYGHGRTSYHNHETGDHYNYLTNQSGSVTGLTKDGEAVASTSYNLYGSTTRTTDETGNPFAYNGEARDITGLDYLRARYYDSQAGTFLTEDSYQGQLTNPLSQNRYTYVHNNPVNYTDPSGHFLKDFVKGAKNLYHKGKRMLGNAWNGAKNLYNQGKRMLGNAWNAVKSTYNEARNWLGNQWNNAKQWVGQQWNNFTQTPVYRATQRAYYGASSYVAQKYEQATQTVNSAWEQAKATGQSVYNWGVSKSKEAANIARNWTKSLEETIRHVCTTADRIGKQTMDFLKKVDWKKVAIVATATVAAIAVTALTAGAAAPLIAGMMGVTSSALAMGTVGFGTTVAIGVATGAVSGAAGGATYGWLEGNLSRRSSKTITQNTLSGGLNGFVSGGLTGGLGSALTSSTAGLSNPLLRYGADTASETVVDTLVDSATGGDVTPASVATNLAFNAVTEGVSTHALKGAKANIAKNKPKAGDVPVTKPRKDVTPVQQLALPGPANKPLALPAPEPILALPAPKSTPKTDFYVNPDGTVYSALDIAASSDVTKLYHYTSDAGVEGIINSNQLHPSLKANNPKDARYGNGQYFTDISPGSLTNPQLSSKFITIPFQGNKFANYIEVDVTGLGVIKGRDGVYVVPNDKSLDISNRILDYGKN